MVLHLEEEVPAAEQVLVFVGDPARLVVAVGEKSFVHVATQTGGEADETLRVPGEQILVDARLVIEAFEEACGDQADEVAVALLVFAEQDEVVIAVGVAAGFEALPGDVDLATDDRVDAFVARLVVELDRAEEVAVVRHGDGGHVLG